MSDLLAALLEPPSPGQASRWLFDDTGFPLVGRRTLHPRYGLTPVPEWLPSPWQSRSFPAIDATEAIRQWIERLHRRCGWESIAVEHKVTGVLLQEELFIAEARKVIQDCGLIVQHVCRKKPRVWSDMPDFPDGIPDWTPNPYARLSTIVWRCQEWFISRLAAAKEMESVVPVWDRQSRTLCYRGEVIRTYKTDNAASQFPILEAFQLEGWPEHILNPLGIGRKDAPGKDRLREALKALNSGISKGIISFHGDGTGDGVRWQTNLQENLPSPPSPPLSPT
ncbi:MAG: hypothetical protein RIC55_35895 [Pirellulaceae bacterium]